MGKECRLCADKFFTNPLTQVLQEELLKKYSYEEISDHYAWEHRQAWLRQIDKENAKELMKRAEINQKTSPSCPLCAISSSALNYCIFFKNWNIQLVNNELKDLNIPVEISKEDLAKHRLHHITVRNVSRGDDVSEVRKVLKDLKKIGKVNGLEDVEMIKGRINTTILQIADLEKNNQTWSEEYSLRVEELHKWLKLKQEFDGGPTQNINLKGMITIEQLRAIVNSEDDVIPPSTQSAGTSKEKSVEAVDNKKESVKDEGRPEEGEDETST